MNRLFLLLLVFFQSFALGQSTALLDGSYVSNAWTTRNYVKNPHAQKNTANVTPSNVTIARSTTTPLYAGTEFNLTSTAATWSATWAVNAVDASLANRTCEARAYIRGTVAATAYFKMFDGATEKYGETITPSATNATWYGGRFACGALSGTLTVVIGSSGATTGALEVSGVYFGEAMAEPSSVGGPASATDDAIVRFDGTTGKLIQNYTSGAPTVSDTGVMLVSNLINIGSGATNSTDPAVNINRTLTGAGNSHAFSDSSTFNKDAATAYASYDARIKITGSTARDHYVSLQAAPTFDSYSGTMTNLYGVYSTANTGSGATITNYSAFRAADLSGSSTVTNNYGLYIEEQTVGTNKYSIYSASTSSAYFSGYLAEFGNNNTNGNESVIRWIGKTSGGTAQYAQWEYKNTGKFQLTSGAKTGFISTDVATGGVTIGTASITAPHTIQNANVGDTVLYIKSLYATDKGRWAAFIMKTEADSSTAQKFVAFQVNNGGTNQGEIRADGGTSVAFATISDVRVKKNIHPLSGQLAKITALKPVSFEMRSDGRRVEAGLIAQDVLEVYPSTVSKDSDGMYSLTGWTMTDVRLIAAIQEQQVQIACLVNADTKKQRQACVK
jgi:hypothetical protein